MERTLILECNNKIGETVKICGFVQVRRDHGKIIFLDVLDRSGVIQVVAMGELAVDLRPQDVVCIEGEISKRPEKLVNPNLETGEIELQAKNIEVLAKAEELPFDIAVKELDLQLPTLLDNRSLTLRHPKVRNIFKVQQAILSSFRKAAEELGCTEIVVPTITAGATEGGAEVFRVDYYGYKGFLAQSPQLYKQIMVPVFERVFSVTKAYRAEPSVTTRHLSESTQMDCEFGFVNFEDLLNYLEGVAKGMISGAAEKYKDILKEFGVEQPMFDEVPRLTLREAQEIILKKFDRDNREEPDLTPADEIDICKWAKEKYNSDLVTITHFPTKKKPFYTMPDPENPEYSLSYDLLFRGVEVSSGSQRINDYNQLVESMKSRGIDPKDFEMYLQAFRYGVPPEGGFSFGLERITMHILGLSNVREASLFPRDMERVDVRLSTLK